MRSIFFALVTLLIIGLPSAVAGQAGGPSAPENTVLRPGDRVRIAVYRNGDLSGEFEIAGSGAIQHPLYRDVVIAGLPLAGAEARIQDFLTVYQDDPQFTFEPLVRVYMGGETLQRSGNYHLPPHMTVADAIRDAGGSTAPNRGIRMRFIRDGESVVVGMNEEAADVLRQQVKSGDQIVLERRPTVMGSIVSPIVSITTGFWSIYSILNAAGLFDAF